MYKRKQKLDLSRRMSVYITEDSYLALRELKRKKGISMAKIVCNLILKEYENKINTR